MPVKVLKRLALYFWLVAPVAIVARELQLNPKTVRRHYDLIQQGIGRQARSFESYAAQSSEKGGLSLLVSAETTTAEVTPELDPRDLSAGSSVYLWWYSGLIGNEALQTGITCQVFLADGVGQESFSQWFDEFDKLAKIVRKLCQMKRGAIDKLLLSEAVFRFNYRKDPGATAILYSFMKNR